MLESTRLSRLFPASLATVFLLALQVTPVSAQDAFPSAVPQPAKTQDTAPLLHRRPTPRPAFFLDRRIYWISPFTAFPNSRRKPVFNNSGDVYLPLIDYVHVGG